jgi:hypothetical protein
MVALRDVAADLSQKCQGMGGFDALGDDAQAEVVASSTTLRTIIAF